MNQRNSNILFRAVMSLSLLCAALATQAGEAIDERRAMNSDGRVTVINVKGEIEVSGWEREEVHVSGDLGRGSKALEITGDGDSLRIEVKLPNNTHGIEETDLVVMLPRTAMLEVEGVSADITVTDMDSPSIKAESVSGDVRIDAFARELEVASVSGDVEADGEFINAEIGSVSGDARISGVQQNLSASSVSGDLEAIGGVLKRARFESVSGEVEVTASLASDGLMTVESLSGDVTLNLPKDLSVNCEAESFSGKISSDMGSPEKARYGPESSVEYQIGDGSARIRVETFSGDVKIRHN